MSLVVLLAACGQLSGANKVPGAPGAASVGPLVCAPFEANPLGVGAMDVDPRSGTSKSAIAGISVYDDSDVWRWRLPDGTPIRAMAAGTVVAIIPEEPWRCGVMHGVATRVNVQLDRPVPLQVGYGLLVPAVSVGDRVTACSVIGHALAEPVACGSNFAFTAFDTRSGARVDPFSWSVDGESPHGLWGVSDEDYARLLGR